MPNSKTRCPIPKPKSGDDRAQRAAAAEQQMDTVWTEMDACSSIAQRDWEIAADHIDLKMKRRGSRTITISLASVIVALLAILTSAESYIANGDNDIVRRITGTHCQLLMNVGRTPATTGMPPEWGASGARLGLNLDLSFTETVCTSVAMNIEALAMLGANQKMMIQPLNQPSFVSMEGLQVVDVEAGAYSCQLQSPETQQYALRFFLDFQNEARRNDIVSSDLLDVSCHCFRRVSL